MGTPGSVMGFLGATALIMGLAVGFDGNYDAAFGLCGFGSILMVMYLFADRIYRNRGDRK